MEKTYAIITYNGDHYLLSDKQELKLRNSLITDILIFNNKKIKVNTIDKVLTIDEYYKNYQKETVKKEFFEIKKIKNSRRTAMMGIRRGLANYINSPNYQGTANPSVIVALADDRLSE